MILEDEPLIAHLQKMLEAEGFRNLEVIVTCADAEIWVMNRTPVVALIDVRLKDSSSAGVATILRDRNLPLIVCSGTSQSDADAAFNSATSLPKPRASELAGRMGTSTNLIREALQQLRGEGYVIMTPNRGARVRPIDEEFVRDICEIDVLIEPALTRWFVGVATRADVEELEQIQADIEALNFSEELAHSQLDMRFHRLMYDKHYNRHAVDLWIRHREILWAISRGFPTSLGRQSNVLAEHRELLDCISRQDAEARRLPSANMSKAPADISSNACACRAAGIRAIGIHQGKWPAPWQDEFARGCR